MKRFFCTALLLSAITPAQQHFSTPRLLNERVRVPANGTNWICFRPNYDRMKFYGNFEASGGANNDIEVGIGEEIEAKNWLNGHGGSLLWHSNGKRTAARFEAPVQRGSYCIVFSNRFSAVSAKSVVVEAWLER